MISQLLQLRWQTDLRQPRWLTPWETGFFDKEMLESLVTRDYFLPTQVGKQKLTTSKIAPKVFLQFLRVPCTYAPSRCQLMHVTHYHF